MARYVILIGVVRMALLNAASVASLMLTTEALIAERNRSTPSN